MAIDVSAWTVIRDEPGGRDKNKRWIAEVSPSGGELEPKCRSGCEDGRRGCFAVPVYGDLPGLEVLVILAAAFGGRLVGYAKGRRR